MTVKNHIEGVFTLQSAMHVAEFDKKGETVQKPIITPSGRFYMPFFPANDLRGRFRRKAASRIFAGWKKRGQTISEALYLGLTCGAASGNPENDKSVEEVVRANSNVYMGVFGGGMRMLRAGYRVNDLDVVSQTCIDAGVVPAHYGEPTEGGFVPMEYRDKQSVAIRDGFKLLHTYSIVRVDDILRAVRAEELSGIIEGGNEAIAAHQASMLGERSDGKAAKAAEKVAKEAAKEDKVETKVAVEKVARNRVENIMSFNAVAAGTPFYFRMDMSDTLTGEQVGLLILCLRDLVEEGELGGYVRFGMGRVAVRTMKLVVNGESFQLFDDTHDLIFSAKAKELADLAETAIDKLTREEMNLFFVSSKSEKP